MCFKRNIRKGKRGDVNTIGTVLTGNIHLSPIATELPGEIYRSRDVPAIQFYRQR